jgi:hypothetical protein
MGREAAGHAARRGVSGAVRAILESDSINLRGEVRARFRRDRLIDWRVEGEGLCLLSDSEARVLMLGAKEAAGWMDIKASAVPVWFTATLSGSAKA